MAPSFTPDFSVKPARWTGLWKDIEELTPSANARANIRSLKRFYFVSYARDDAEKVRPFIEAALGAGHSLWLDQANLGLGRPWSADIVAAIRASRGVILFGSHRSFQSDDVYREIAMAGRLKKPILPVLMDSAPIPDGFLYYLSIHQAIRPHQEWRRAFLSALRTLSKNKPTRSVPQSVITRGGRKRPRGALTEIGTWALTLATTATTAGMLAMAFGAFGESFTALAQDFTAVFKL